MNYNKTTWTSWTTKSAIQPNQLNKEDLNNNGVHVCVCVCVCNANGKYFLFYLFVLMKKKFKWAFLSSHSFIHSFIHIFWIKLRSRIGHSCVEPGNILSSVLCVLMERNFFFKILSKKKLVTIGLILLGYIRNMDVNMNARKYSIFHLYSWMNLWQSFTFSSQN